MPSTLVPGSECRHPSMGRRAPWSMTSLARTLRITAGQAERPLNARTSIAAANCWRHRLSVRGVTWKTWGQAFDSAIHATQEFHNCVNVALADDGGTAVSSSTYGTNVAANANKKLKNRGHAF